MRKIIYVTGTRADFGLMRKTLAKIQKCDELNLSIFVTGMHLDKRFGYTIKDIENEGLDILAKISPDTSSMPSGQIMAKAIGNVIIRFVDVLNEFLPDAILLLGDRGEMLASAIAAIHLNIPIIHIHGGERSGTIDEPIRHAISKLSHYHFVATQNSRERLIKMGEKEENIFVVGAPGLDGLEEEATLNREQLMIDVGFDLNKPVALFVFHPVVQDVKNLYSDTIEILNNLLRKNFQIVAIKPNSDSGSSSIMEALEFFVENSSIRIYANLSRTLFVSWMASVDLMIGNSSSGIIEAATFGTPVINIGMRQNLRERNINVFDLHEIKDGLEKVIDMVLAKGRFERNNIYGDGMSSERILNLLNSISLNKDVLMKSNVY